MNYPYHPFAETSPVSDHTGFNGEYGTNGEDSFVEVYLQKI
jgi:hypothetical protein